MKADKLLLVIACLSGVYYGVGAVDVSTEATSKLPAYRHDTLSI